MPELARGASKMAPGIAWQDGLNVMDVSDYQTPMQMLFVQSAIFERSPLLSVHSYAGLSTTRDSLVVS